MFVLAIVIPGLLYAYYGQRTLRLENYAILSWHLSYIWILSWFIIGISTAIVESNLGPITDISSDNRLILFYQFVDSVFPWIIVPIGLIFYLPISKGQIVILRVDWIVVQGAIKGIIDRYQLRYTVDEDVIRIPSIKAKISIGYLYWSRDHIGIRTSVWDRVWYRNLNEDVLDAFKGTTSQRTYPTLRIIGSLTILIGILIGGVIALD